MSEERLFELINLSIDSLECGSVNFKALRALLHGIVTRLFTEIESEDVDAGRDAGPWPGRDKKAALEQQFSSRELPRGKAEDSAPELQRGQAEHSAPELQRGQAEHSAPELHRGQAEHSAPELQRGQADHSAPELRMGQPEHSAPELQRGQADHITPELQRLQAEHSAPELQRGQVEDSAPELQRGQAEESASKLQRGGQIEDSDVKAQVEDSDEKGHVEESDEDSDEQGHVEDSAGNLPTGQVEESALEFPRGQVEESAPEFQRGQMEESDLQFPTGQIKESDAKLQRGEVEESGVLPRGEVQDPEKKRPLSSNLVQDLFKENQDLKEKTCNLKKEVETLQNQITQLVTLEHVQSTLDCQKESIMKELKDYVSKTQLSDAIGKFNITAPATSTSDEAVPQPRSQDLTQSSIGVETQRVLILIHQLQEKLDSLEARMKYLEGDVRTPLLSQQQIDPNSQGALMDVNQLLEKIDSLEARLKLVEGDIRSPLMSQQQIDPNSKEPLIDVNQLWEKIDSLEARVKHLDGDITSPVFSQQEIDGSSQGALQDVNQLWEKFDSLEARMQHLEDDYKSPLLSHQQTDSSSQGAEMDIDQLQEMLDSLEARMTQLEGERENLLDQFNQLKTYVMSDQMEDMEMVFKMESLAEDPVNMSGSSDSGKEFAISETTEQSSDRFSGTEQQLHMQSGDIRMAVQKLQKDMQCMYRELRSLRQGLRGSIQKDIQDETTEMSSDMQGVVLQLQAKFDKLHSTTTQLMNEHVQEQSHIKHLYKTTKELDDKKADKTTMSVGKDFKSDMEALEAKVDLCDATANKLDKNYHDLISIITDHEENCCLKIDEILTEMKLKVDPLKKQIKICQMNIQKALDVPKVDDAAGFKKKLLTRYNCLSCDRAVNLQTPGPHMIVLPELPNLPPSKIQRRVRKGSNIVKETDTFALDKKVFNENQDGMRSPVDPTQAGTSSLQKEKQWIPEESIP